MLLFSVRLDDVDLTKFVETAVYQIVEPRVWDFPISALTVPSDVRPTTSPYPNAVVRLVRFEG
jgi:hypothetical protein